METPTICNPCGTVALLKFDKPGDLLLAGRAPGGPEVEHHGLAAQIAELEVVPFKIGENEVGCGAALGGDGRGGATPAGSFT